MDKLIAVVILSIVSMGTVDTCELFQLTSDPECVAEIVCESNKYENNINSLVEQWSCIRIENRNYNHYNYRYESYGTHITYKSTYSLHLKIKDTGTEGANDLLMNINNDIRIHVKTIKILVDDMKSLPKTIYDLREVTDIDLSNNVIENINLYNFLGQNSLKNISLKNNFLSIMETDVVEDLEQISLSIIDLSHNYIEVIPKNCFARFINLKHLDLSHNSIQSFNTLSFEGTTQLETLQLSNNKLQEIGLSFIKLLNLKELSLDNNQLASLIEPNFISMSKLERLNLSSNYLKNIEDLSFQNLPNLLDLDMSYNQIQNITKLLFRNNSRLSSLNLSNNHLKILEPGIFEGKNITSFRIENNNLTGTIINNSFVGIYISELDLSKGEITALGPNAFTSLNSNLLYLNLSSNAINDISESSFSLLEHLRKLDLSNNYVQEIQFKTADLSSLSLLLLKNNSIKSIRANSFNNLVALTELDLSYNKITDIESDSFINLMQLKTLNLNYNNLVRTLKSHIFQGLSELKSLELSNTRIFSIENGTFSVLNKLQIVNSSNGELSMLGYNAFGNTGSIEILDLSYNILDTFSVNISTIANIKELYLHYNKISNITNQTFLGLTLLKTLNLACNNIIRLESSSFNSLIALFNLNLSTNVEMEISGNIFDNLVRLEVVSLKNIRKKFTFEQAKNSSITNLDITSSNIIDVNTIYIYQIKNIVNLKLNSNKFTFVDKYSFKSMPSLNFLDLSYNKISYIQPGSFLKTNNIKTLNLYGNQISSLQFGVFDGLKNVENLNFSNNLIHIFEVNILHNLPKISNISLDDNVIESIHFGDFVNTKVKEISIGGNPIPCDAIAKLKFSSFSFDVTAERLDYHSENVHGITCRTVSNIDKKGAWSHINNHTQVNETLSTFVNTLDFLCKSVDRTNNTNFPLDNNSEKPDLKDIMAPMEQLSEVINISQVITNDNIKQISDINNEIRSLLGDINRNIKNYCINNAIPIGNKIEVNESTNIKETENFIDKVKYQTQTIESDAINEIKYVLYIIMMCLVILVVIVLIATVLLYKSSNLSNSRILQSNSLKSGSNQEIVNMMDMIAN